MKFKTALIIPAGPIYDADTENQDIEAELEAIDVYLHCVDTFATISKEEQPLFHAWLISVAAISLHDDNIAVVVRGS